MIKIQLEQAERVYSPQDWISGTVNWSAIDEADDRLEIRLIWYTQGKGTRDVHLREVVEHSIQGAKGSQAFQILAPRRPYSFSGKLVSLQWAVEAIFFPSMDSQTKTLVVAPGGQELKLEKSYQDVVEKRSVIRVGK